MKVECNQRHPVATKVIKSISLACQAPENSCEDPIAENWGYERM